MKKTSLLFLLIFLSIKFLSAQSAFVDLIGTGEDQFTFIPPPPQFQLGLRTATFNIIYNGYTTDAQSAFQYAADIWGSILISNIPIKVNTYFTVLPGNLLGITLPNGRKDFPNAPLTNTWYSTSLANALSDSELNAGENDVDLYLNSTTNWYFGTDGNCPAGKYDFVSVALHELCHGLGFVGLGKVASGIGSFGLVYASDFPGIVTSFPWPDLDTLPSVFDLHLTEYGGGFLSSYANPSADLATQFTNNSVWFYGDSSQAANPLRPHMYAPATFILGSSLLHLNESTYPAGNINELMTPFSGTAEATHDPGPITIGILKDIGWNVNYTVGVKEVSATNGPVKIFPNPVRNQFTVYAQHPVGNLQFPIDAIEISDMMGRKILEVKQPRFPLDVSNLSGGIFFCRIKCNNEIVIEKFVKQ
ncbi:MAG TPA: T9SS type A sorting domain-containing protein [Chitinophagales bacterium]|nr:T9SS type A sorting domain-containing protein [Chitinophagales bacterium]